MKPLKVLVRVVQQPLKPAVQVPPKPRFGGVGVWFGVALAVSESLPFVDTEYNGILHALKAVQTELSR